MRRGTRATLLTTLAAAIATILPLAAAPAASAAPSTLNGVRLNGYEARLVADINSTRRAHGLSSLVVAAGTSDVARRWSGHMASTEVLSHNPSLVSNVAAAGAGNWHAIAENVGYASAGSPDQLFTAYMNSPMHRANILDSSVRYLGVGVVERGGYAWNTLDFVDSYSTSYGTTRVPATGMTIDRYTPAAGAWLATFESGTDQRWATGGSGGVSVGRLATTTPSSTRDDYAYATLRRVSSASGWGVAYMRDAVDLHNAGHLVVTLGAVTASHHVLYVHVRLRSVWSGPIDLGYHWIGSKTTFSVPVPAAQRTLRPTLELASTAPAIGYAGNSASLRVYGVRTAA